MSLPTPQPHLLNLSAFILHHFTQTLAHSSLLSFPTPPHLCQLLTEGTQGQLPSWLLQQHTQVCVGIPAPSPSLLFSHTVGRGEKRQSTCNTPAASPMALSFPLGPTKELGNLLNTQVPRLPIDPETEGEIKICYF